MNKRERLQKKTHFIIQSRTLKPKWWRCAVDLFVSAVIANQPIKPIQKLTPDKLNDGVKIKNYDFSYVLFYELEKLTYLASFQ